MEPQKTVTSLTMGHALQFEVIREHGVAADIGKHRERRGGDDCAADGQAVQTIRQVHGIARTDNDQRHKENERNKRQDAEVRNCAQRMDEEVGAKALEERHHQVRGVHSLAAHGQQHHGNGHPADDLQAHLLRGREAQTAPLDDLDVVIGKPDRAEGQRREHDQPYERVGEIAPQQGGQQNSDTDKYAAHGWRAGFFLVIFGAVFADVLANLELAQLFNDEGPDQQGNEHRGQAGKRSTKRQIPKDAEGSEVRKKFLVQQPVKQTSSAPLEGLWLSYSPRYACQCEAFTREPQRQLVVDVPPTSLQGPPHGR